MLKISKDLSLPIEAVTETFAILAKRRVGKTYTASVIAEEMGKAGLPFVVLDPTGAWWGLRAAANGNDPGLPVVIFGGQHGDLPLDPNGGAAIAELVVEHPGFYVIDLSASESDAQQDRFATAFAQKLYRLKDKNREPLHLFVDEADSFAPQKPYPGQQAMLGAFEALIRRGGIRGIGMTLITQRAAVLNKNVLSQCEIMIALQTTSPHDQDAVKNHMERNGTPEQVKALMGSLASLGKGEAWFYSPTWLDEFRRLQIRERETFNSSATPKVGEKRIEPKRLADVDISALRDRMAAAIEEEKANDPQLLKKRVAELQRQIQSTPKEVERVEVPVLSEEMVSLFTDTAHELIGCAKDLHSIGESILTKLNEVSRQAPALKPIAAPARAVVTVPAPQRVVTPAKPAGGGIVGAQQKVLNALAFLEQIGMPQPERAVLAYMSGYTVNGHFNNMVGELKTSGRVEYPIGGCVCLTDEGRALADTSAHMIRTRADLHNAVLSKFSASEQKILSVLISVYPNEISRGELAEATGYTVNGHFNNMVGRFSSLGFATYPRKGTVRAADTLFPDALQ